MGCIQVLKHVYPNPRRVLVLMGRSNLEPKVSNIATDYPSH